MDSQRRVRSVNPATGEVLREFACASDEEVRATVIRAHEAQRAWCDTSVRDRLEVVRKF
jgi:succinate-semialdehyde dehydrogenase/glutarate-semialdehyde dehydrogenase